MTTAPALTAPAAGAVQTPVRKCRTAGFTVDLGDQFPAWCPDMGAVRKLLAERDLIAAEVTT